MHSHFKPFPGWELGKQKEVGLPSGMKNGGIDSKIICNSKRCNGNSTINGGF